MRKLNDYKNDLSSIVVKTQEFTRKTLKQSNFLGKYIACLLAALCLINSHFLLFLRLQKSKKSNLKIEFNINGTFQTNFYNNQTFECTSEFYVWYTSFLETTWFWVDIFIFFFIPFTTMCITFLFIKFKLNTVNRNYASFLQDKTQNTHNKSIYSRKIERNKHIVCVLFGTNVYFFFSILPFFLFNILKTFNNLLSSRELQFVKPIVDILFFSNNALNIFFYGLTSKEFRKMLNGIFCKRKKRQSNTEKKNCA